LVIAIALIAAFSLDWDASRFTLSPGSPLLISDFDAVVGIALYTFCGQLAVANTAAVVLPRIT